MKKITIITISESVLTEAFSHLTKDDLNKIVTEEDAQSVIDNPNFREILDTIYK